MWMLKDETMAGEAGLGDNQEATSKGAAWKYGIQLR